jgi:hypothetical protein
MIRKPTLALLALVPLIALAAPTPPPGKAEPVKGGDAAAPAAGTELDVPAAPLEGGARAGEGTRTPAAPPDTYTVRPGDTLWDLSGRFLNNPWYWPKIWAYNPEVSNPHWIYPGNQLRFFPSGDEGPAQVMPLSPEEPVAEVEEAPGEPVKELEDLSKADMSKPASEEEKDVVSVAGPYAVGQVAPRSQRLQREAFVTSRELEESGSIRASFEEKAMLTTFDKAYATFKVQGNVKVGETYAVYRTLRQVTHPVTKELVGYQTLMLGTAKVVAVHDKVATLTIAASYYAIERGDMLGPWAEKSIRPVQLKANAKNLRGFIVSSPIEAVDQLAQNQFVFVDLGKADGIEEGNSLVVVRAGDPRDSADEARKKSKEGLTLPNEDVGALVVVDVREKTSAAMVTKSVLELKPGDKVEMRAAGN